MFLTSELSILTYANNFTQWHYRSTTDDMMTIMMQGYFDQATAQLKENDLIMVNPLEGGVRFLVVHENLGHLIKTTLQS